MPRLSWTLISSGIFLGYSIYSIYSISLLFMPQPCEVGKPCLQSILNDDPKLSLHMFVSPMSKPISSEVSRIYSNFQFNHTAPMTIPVNIKIPDKTRRNGTLFLHVIIVPQSSNIEQSFIQLQKHSHAVYERIKMTQFIVPEAKTFNLLGEKKVINSTNKDQVKPVSHLRSRLTFTMVIDTPEMPLEQVPTELLNGIRVIQGGLFLPIVNYDFLQTRFKDLVEITSSNYTMNITIFYTPTSMGNLRLMLHLKSTMEGLKRMGFSDKDLDEVKGVYSDTNVYLLTGTIFIATMHLLFDFLAFKNDISFWKSKGTFEGLSISTIVWRAFSQAIIFIYLLDEGSSLLVLIPAGIGTLIEFWKTKKVLRIEIVRSDGLFPKLQIRGNKNDDEETKTRKFDAESMRYLMYLLYPLVIAGAIYSLLYQPHKSWYSWTVNSLVNGVYAFGFLFMLPQLFVNYKLKSVAHLPWRAFMYKAFNTFIDDVFAFTITMPVAHRVACFRDDAVFLVYLYQRWLYPVDKSRRDTITITEEVDSVYEDASNKKND